MSFPTMPARTRVYAQSESARLESSFFCAFDSESSCSISRSIIASDFVRSLFGSMQSRIQEERSTVLGARTTFARGESRDESRGEKREKKETSRAGLRACDSREEEAVYGIGGSSCEGRRPVQGRRPDAEVPPNKSGRRVLYHLPRKRTST